MKGAMERVKIFLPVESVPGKNLEYCIQQYNIHGMRMPMWKKESFSSLALSKAGIL